MSRSLKSLLLLAITPVACLSAADAPMTFDKATYTEIVHQVTTVHADTGKTDAAKPGEVLTAPDLVKSGRAARAQLTLTDGTVIRVGANAVFSLEKSTRTLRLEQGSVLFYTPPGHGGGRIVTDAVTCSVTGTTVILSKGVNGTSLQVLEGTANFSRNGGTPVSVTGGHLAFATNNPTGPISITQLLQGTVINPELVNGFSTPLPSLSKIIAVFGGPIGGTGTITNTNTGVSGQNNTSPGQTPIPNISQTGVISPNGEGNI